MIVRQVMAPDFVDGNIVVLLVGAVRAGRLSSPRKHSAASATVIADLDEGAAPAAPVQPLFLQAQTS